MFLVTDTEKIGVGLSDSTYVLCAMESDLVWSKTGTVLSPKTANDAIDIQTSTNGFAVKGVAQNPGGYIGGEFISEADGGIGITGLATGIISQGGLFVGTGYAIVAECNTNTAPVVGVFKTSTVDNVAAPMCEQKHSSAGATTGFGVKDTIDITGAISSEVHTVRTAATTVKREVWLINAGTLTKVHQIDGDGKHTLPTYGSGTFMGTVAKLLAVTASGEVIETDEPDTSNWTKTGTTLTPKVANDIVDVTTNVALANAIKGLNGEGIGVYGEGLNGVKGVATESGVGTTGEATEGNGVVATNTKRDNATHRVTKTTSADGDSIGNMIVMQRKTGGDAVEGLGGSLLWQIDDNDGNNLDAGQIDVKWTGVGVSSQMDVYLRRNGTYERKLALLQTGQAILDQYGSNSFTGTAAQNLAVTSSGEVIEGVVPQAINSQSGTTYTLAATDAGKLIRMTNSAAITLTIPKNSTIAIPVGTKIEVEQVGAGVVTATEATDVTINPAAKKTWGQYSVITLQKVATDVWNVIGGSA